MTTYRAAVVGLTGIGAAPFQPAPDPVLGVIEPHSHVGAYAEIPNTTVVGACDLVPALLDKFRSDWGATFPDAHVYTDYREMLEKEKPDLLSVVTSDHRHAQIVVDAAQAGVKGIFCEKPIATSLADADRMIAACRERGVPMLIDHTRRWYPEFQQARQLVRSSAIGQLKRVVATLGGPRAMLFRNGTHLIDTICFFVESDPQWLVAELDDEHASYGPRYAGDGGRDPAKDPGGSGLIHFQNGVRAFVNASKGTMGNFELDLIGETGRIRIGTHAYDLWQQNDKGVPFHRHLRPPQTTRGDMVAAIEELIGLIEHGGAGSSSAADGRRVLSILLAMLQSGAKGSGKVTFPIQDA